MVGKYRPRERFATNWPNYDSYGYKWYNHTLIIDGEAIHYVFASGNGGNNTNW